MTCIRDNTEAGRFEAQVDGKTAFLAYKLAGGVISLVHTEVPKELAGRGIGAELARHALETAGDRGYKVEVICPFVASYIRRHPQYEWLLTKPLPAAPARAAASSA
jgi:predicted GNAT family acetyltransferase